MESKVICHVAARSFNSNSASQFYRIFPVDSRIGKQIALIRNGVYFVGDFCALCKCRISSTKSGWWPTTTTTMAANEHEHTNFWAALAGLPLVRMHRCKRDHRGLSAYARTAEWILLRCVCKRCVENEWMALRHGMIFHIHHCLFFVLWLARLQLLHHQQSIARSSIFISIIILTAIELENKWCQRNAIDR